jgi:tetratricopeptide (TPR) repeat protein
MVAPKDAIAYYELRGKVLQLLGSPAEAEPLIEQIVREYPRDPENWKLLGLIKRGVNKPAEAAAALEKARDIAGLRREPLPIAAAYLAAGDERAALATLRRGVFDDRTIYRQQLFEAGALAPLRNNPEMRAIAGRADTTGVSRVEGWRRDLDYLYNEALRVSPDYRSGNGPPAFTRAYQELRKNVPSMSREQFMVGLNRMLATLRQGHTGLFGGAGIHHLPVQFYVFPEGIYIVRAADRYESLVGTRLVSIGRTPAEEALRLVNRMLSVDGDLEHLGLGAAILRKAEFLKGSGIDIAIDSVQITVESPEGQRRTVALIGPDIPGSLKLPAPPRVQAPLFLRRVQESHWEQALPERNALYVQMNQVRNDPDETLPAFGIRLWSVLEAQKPRNVIIDLRHNTGGSTSLYPELLRTLIAYTRVPDRKVFALIGRTTYSAAGNFITDLERLVNPIFVGEASSECCNLNGDFAQVQLPHIGLTGTIAGVRWNLSGDVFDGRREMSPHVPVQLTAAAYFAGLDPALDAVFKMIDRGIK